MKKYDKLVYMRLQLPKPADVAHKFVLVRVDFNVPLHKKWLRWRVADDLRLKAALATINFLIKNQAKIVLISHLGRPVARPNRNLSLAPVAKHLAGLLGKPVKFVGSAVGAGDTQKQIASLKDGEVALLENLRFYQGEEDNNQQFASQLAAYGQVFINESFATSHRAHASVAAITSRLPSFAGFNLEKEVSMLSFLLEKPRRPFVMIIGGAKINDKVAAVLNLADKTDMILVGGGVANNFIKAEGYHVGKSYLEEKETKIAAGYKNFVQVAKHLLQANKLHKVLLDTGPGPDIPLPKILYPIDVLAGKNINDKKAKIINLTDQTPNEVKNLMYLDIGPKTIDLYKQIISQAGTIFWNGPMGVTENKVFAGGSRAIAQAIARSRATSILGGGDTISLANQLHLASKYTYLSTAGGAALDFLAGKNLPGLVPLLKNSKQKRQVHNSKG